ncbi:hypothetical protein ABBQ32_008004 [Trebouxia sp. C0010 RCD-2024]
MRTLDSLERTAVKRVLKHPEGECSLGCQQSNLLQSVNMYRKWDSSAMLHNCQPHNLISLRLSEQKVFGSNCENAVLQDASLTLDQQQQSVTPDDTGQYVQQLLEPAFIAVPAAVDIPALFQSALHISGTLPFPVPDAFYESQRLQDRDMEFFWHLDDASRAV